MRIESKLLFCAWLDINYPEIPYYAIPNGGYRNKVTAAILKQTGVKAGIPDMAFPIKRGKFNSLYIELKTLKGSVSAVQKQWHLKLRAEGSAVFVAKGFKECLKGFEAYINLP